jgi:phosphoglycolate phosphatase-like HAD superfamily hydrolase
MVIDSKNRYLILSDFDGTLVDTFTPSPNNLGVSEASSLAVRDVFGDEGTGTYESIGGLGNRAPSELVADILKENPGLLKEARNFAKERGLDWSGADSIKAITELFVQCKLKKLLGEVGEKFPDGRVWPALYDGVPKFFKKVEEINARGEISLDVGILSSGHKEFIEKTFSLWNIKSPQVMVTDDDIRQRKYPEEQFRRIKPSSFLFAYAHWKWLSFQGVTPKSFDLASAIELRNRAIYIGDDPVKDGNLAREAKVPFCLFDRGKNKNLDETDQFCFREWDQLNRILEQPELARRMREGAPFSEILQSSFQELRNELKISSIRDNKLPPIR